MLLARGLKKASGSGGSSRRGVLIQGKEGYASLVRYSTVDALLSTTSMHLSPLLRSGSKVRPTQGAAKCQDFSKVCKAAFGVRNKYS